VYLSIYQYIYTTCLLIHLPAGLRAGRAFASSTRGEPTRKTLDYRNTRSPILSPLLAKKRSKNTPQVGGRGPRSDAAALKPAGKCGAHAHGEASPTCKLHAGDHSFLRMLRQISPVWSHEMQNEREKEGERESQQRGWKCVNKQDFDRAARKT